MLSLRIWPLQSEQKSSCFALFVLIYDKLLFCFLCNIHFLYLSSCTRKVLFTSRERQRLPSKVSAFRNKFYKMLTYDTCLLVPSARDFHILPCMLKTASIKFLHIVFFTFFIFQWYSLNKF